MNFHFFLLFLLAELAVLILLMSAIIIHRILFAIIQKRDTFRKETLSNYFLELITKNIDFQPDNYPGAYSWHHSLLSVFEAFNTWLISAHYDRIKEAVANHLLLPIARKKAHSIFWLNRNFAARTFAVLPTHENELEILHLINDKHFLVKGPAAQAALLLESKAGIYQILLSMRSELGYARFFYRDMMLKGSRNIFLMVVDLSQDPHVRMACLDLLSAKSGGFLVPFLEKDLQSDDDETRLLATKILIHNPIENAFSILSDACSDPNESIRKTAVSGLWAYPIAETAPILQQALHDPCWQVRVEAAKVLKKQGNAGIDILKKQQDQKALEAIEYMFEFE